jgi:hypothetical protein
VDQYVVADFWAIAIKYSTSSIDSPQLFGSAVHPFGSFGPMILAIGCALYHM